MADADVLADRLAEVAIELMCRVRDDDPRANARWLQAVIGPEELPALAIVLAAAIPVDRPWLELTSWSREHGTGAAAARHEQRGERLCPACRAWVNEPLSTGMSTREAA